MILTCPNCATRYLLAASVLAPEGRRVRCSECREIWFEKPDRDELDNPDPDMPDEMIAFTDADDIPDSVKPRFGANPPEALMEEDQPGWTSAKMGYAAAALLFFVLFGGLIAMQSSMEKLWPESRSFYSTIGFESEIPGARLMLDGVTARFIEDAEHGPAVAVEGLIQNRTDAPENVPVMMVTVLDEDDTILSNWVLDTGVTDIPEKQEFSFEAAYKINEEIKATADTLNIRFTPFPPN